MNNLVGDEFHKRHVDGIVLCIFGGDIKVGGVRKCLVWRCYLSFFLLFPPLIACAHTNTRGISLTTFPSTNTIACISRSSIFGDR